MWLKIKRKTELSIPELTMFLSPAGGEGPSIEDSLLSPTLLETGPTLGPVCAKPNLQKRVAAAATAPATQQSLPCPPGLSCLPVVTAAGKCFSSDGFQSCHSVIPCATRQKTPPRPLSPAHLFPCTPSLLLPLTHHLPRQSWCCNCSSGIFFFLFPRCLITLITLF